MPQDDASSNVSTGGHHKSARKSTGSFNPPRAASPAAAGAPTNHTQQDVAPPAAAGAGGAADRKTKRVPRRMAIELRKAVKKVRQKSRRPAQKAPSPTTALAATTATVTAEAPGSAPGPKRLTAHIPLQDLSRGVKNVKDTAGQGGGSSNEKRQHQPLAVPPAAVPAQVPVAAHQQPQPQTQQHTQPQTQQQQPVQAPQQQQLQRAGPGGLLKRLPLQKLHLPPLMLSPNKQKQEQPTQLLGAKQPQQLGVAGAGAKKAIVERKASIMNLSRLAKDGRKTPEFYREVAKRAQSPSAIDLNSLTEFYDTPNNEFETCSDVLEYRGYKLLAKLDEGAFGQVHAGKRASDNLPVAIKFVDLTHRRSKRIIEMKRELFVLQKMAHHPQVVRMYEHCIAGDWLIIIMELCSGSNLTYYLKDAAIPEEEAAHLFRQMLAGVRALHRAGISHRDIKLNNFLLDETHKIVKVADFGLSTMSFRPSEGVVMEKSYCGTEPYMAPELVGRNARGFRHYIGIQVDIWALGVCLYAMLTRAFPFKQTLQGPVLQKLQVARDWRLPRQFRATLTDEVKDLLWHMLDPEPSRRITITGAVAHPWVATSQVTLTRSD